jgi:5-dehydro-2-deoxygluconokinase
MRRAIEDIQNFGIEVDIWKIEGVDEREDAEMLSVQTRKGEGRENVKSVLLGRGASDAKVDHWLRAAAPVEGFIGFAIGRSIWWDALKSFLDGGDRRASAEQIADNYLRFIKVYDEAARSSASSGLAPRHSVARRRPPRSPPPPRRRRPPAPRCG